VMQSERVYLVIFSLNMKKIPRDGAL